MAACIRFADRAAVGRTDLDLYRLAIAGDRDALEALLTKYRAVFQLWVRRMFRTDNRWTDDCAQEATIRVWLKLALYRPEKSAFSSWAHVVGISAVFSFLRKHKSERFEVTLDAPWAEGLQTLRGPEELYIYQQVREEVEKLELEQWAAVTGHHYEGKSDEEISQARGIERRKVCYRRKQAERRLKRRLGDVHFMTIRPRMRFQAYYIVMDRMTDAHASALLGGEDGDSE
jgi:RNA polymerase sigma factor (sigma-70 family)